MFTSDPIYRKPLVPRITVKNTANTSTLYTYDPWTDAGTTGKPIYCSVQLSQNTHGQFAFEIEAQGYSVPFSVGDRVIIECGKQSTQMTRLISGLIRRRGTLRGADNRVIQHFEGSSTGIRLNERVIYSVSQAAKLPQDGITIDTSDSSRASDNLLQSILLSAGETIIDASTIAANSDVEVFIANVSVEYGELQDVVNYIEDQSGGEVVVDINDKVNLRGEIRTPVGGRGFTIKNKPTSISGVVDDADDTMYLRGKNWSWSDSIYKSDSYANRVYALLPSEPDPSEDIISGGSVGGVQNNQFSVAQKFRPTHSRFMPGDFFFAGVSKNNAVIDLSIQPVWILAGPDTANTPNNLPIIVWVVPDMNLFNLTVSASTTPGIFPDSNLADVSFNVVNSLNLDTTKDYWLTLTSYNASTAGSGKYFKWFYRSTSTGTISTKAFPDGLSPAISTTLGTGWAAPTTSLMWFAIPRRRAHSFVMWDPKAVQAIQTGITAGVYTDSVLSDLSAQIKTKEAMYRHLPQQLYSLARPQSQYDMATVMAPNVPPLPGDPIVISDSVLGLSQSGQRVTLTTCGDMTYQWGSSGGQGMTYQAPTILNISPVGIPSRYK